MSDKSKCNKEIRFVCCFRRQSKRPTNGVNLKYQPVVELSIVNITIDAIRAVNPADCGSERCIRKGLLSRLGMSPVRVMSGLLYSKRIRG